MQHFSDRRRFLVNSVSASLYLPLGAYLLNGCKSVDAAGELSADEIKPGGFKPTELANATSIRLSARDPQNQRNMQLYAKAVAAMKATPFDLPVKKESTSNKAGTHVNGEFEEVDSWWEAHAWIHHFHCPHGDWKFLPWHRAYLNFFEQVCRVFCDDSSFSLPYWDWTSNANIPDEFEVDSTANPLFNSTRSRTGKKELDLIDSIKPKAIAEILRQADFHSFGGSPESNGQLEYGPHNNIHSKIGGDLGRFYSPRDPVFWLHHCNVDRLWEVWRAQVMANNNDPLPSDFSRSGGRGMATRAEWLKLPLEGFYTVTKNGDTYSSTPAKMIVEDVIEASLLGLLYHSPVSASSAPAAPDASDIVPHGSEGSSTPSPVTINALTTNVPTSFSRTSSLKRKWKRSVQKEVPLTASIVDAMKPNLELIRIEGTAQLEDALSKASQRDWTSATLRLTVSGIPTPSDPKARLLIFLNAKNLTADISNPAFVGGISFFGHHHGPDGLSSILSLLHVVKALTASGEAPFGKETPQDLTFTAKWDLQGVTEDLSKLEFRLEYVEHNK